MAASFFDNSMCKMNLEVLADHKLNMGQQCHTAAKEALIRPHLKDYSVLVNDV